MDSNASVNLKAQVSGMCDCGDKDAWAVSGNCSDHGGFIEEDKYLPEERKESLKATIKKTMYFLLQALEQANTEVAVAAVSSALVEILRTLEETGQVYVSLTPVLAKAFYLPMKYCAKEVRFRQNFQDFSGSLALGNEPQECPGLTILQFLLRHSAKISQEAQMQLNKFLISLFVDYKFKSAFAVDFISNFNFYFSHKGTSVIKGNSRVAKIVDISIQIMTSEEFSHLAVEKSKLTEVLTGMMEMLKGYFDEKDNYYKPKYEEVVYRMLHHLNYLFTKRKSIVAFFSNKQLTSLYFDLMKYFQFQRIRFSPKGRMVDNEVTKVSEISDDHMNLEIYYHSNTIEICGVLVTLQAANKFDVLFNILTDLKNKILAEFQAEQSQDAPKPAFNNYLQRTFVIYLVSLCHFQSE